MSNRRLRRMQDRMMKKPKFVEALRRFNDLPTNTEMETYLNQKIELAKTQPAKVLQPITPSEEMIEDFTKHKEEQFDNNIMNYYKTK